MNQSYIQLPKVVAEKKSSNKYKKILMKDVLSGHLFQQCIQSKVIIETRNHAIENILEN